MTEADTPIVRESKLAKVRFDSRDTSNTHYPVAAATASPSKRTAYYLDRLFAEFGGCYIFYVVMFMCDAVAAQNSHLPANLVIGTCDSVGAPQLIPFQQLIGGVLIAAVRAAAMIVGTGFARLTHMGMLNPVIALCKFMTGKMRDREGRFDWLLLILVWLAELVAAFVAATFANLYYKPTVGDSAIYPPTFCPERVEWGTAFFAEFGGATYLSFYFVVFVVQERFFLGSSGASGIFRFAMQLFIATFMFYQISGSSFNPFSALALGLVGSAFEGTFIIQGHDWIYFVAPWLGGVFAFILYWSSFDLWGLGAAIHYNMVLTNDHIDRTDQQIIEVYNDSVNIVQQQQNDILKLQQPSSAYESTIPPKMAKVSAQLQYSAVKKTIDSQHDNIQPHARKRVNFQDIENK